jgi:DivIVA domain-containing protein
MELTAADLRAVEFREAWKGYNQADVDTFIDEVAAGVEALQGRIRDLTERAERAERTPVAAAPPDDEAVKRTLALAQRAADLVVSEAKAVAERTVNDANAQAARITAEADAAAARRRDELEFEASRMVVNQVQAADQAHAMRLTELQAQSAAVERELAARRQELDQLRALSHSARDRLRSTLVDVIGRVDLLTADFPEL